MPLLTWVSSGSRRNCEGASRRDFLAAGTLALGSLSLPRLLQAKAAAPSFVRNRSVVLVYLSGGFSHIESFDPKMTAPEGVRSVTGDIATRIPGVTFGATFPELAARADRLAVVRSFSHAVGSHEGAHVHVLSGGTDPLGQQARGHSMGSIATRLRGTNHPVTGLPTYQLLTEVEVDGQYQKELSRVRAGSWPGSLGPSYAPFPHQIGWQPAATRGASSKNGKSDKAPSGANPVADNLRLNLSDELLEDRLQLLRRVDGFRRDLDASGSMEALDQFSVQALNLLQGGAVEAFDFSREDPRLIARYDTSRISIGHKSFRPSTLGKQLLVARRLCEAGCGFVTVHSAGWDMHADGNNPNMEKGMAMLGRSLDQAVSVFLDDVADRGLSDEILLVIAGDFGRTPKVNARGGRDHWPKLGALAFAGGGLKVGQVIGRSAPGADVPASDPVTPAHLLGTVMHSLFDIGQVRIDSSIPADLSRLVGNSQPIPGLL